MSERAGFSADAVDLDAGGLVEASAGTGKTYTIAHLFLRLLVERDRGIDEVLVVTFTEAATAELRARLRARLRDARSAFARVLAAPAVGEAVADDPLVAALVARTADPGRALRRLDEALADVDRAAVHTIHGFCHRLLAEAAFATGAPVGFELTTDQGSIHDELCTDFLAVELDRSEPWRAALLHAAKLTPASVRKLADRALADPELELFPGPPTEAACVPDFAGYRGALARARGVFSEGEIRDLLGRPAMHKAVRATRAAICSAAAELLGGPVPDLPRRQMLLPLEKLTAEHLAEKTKKGAAPPTHPFFDACSQLVERAAALERSYAATLHAVRHALVAFARAELPRRLDQRRVLTFDQLLVRARAALRVDRAGALRDNVLRRHPVALVDEFQDTDPVQYEIFRSVWARTAAAGTARGTLFLVGDPKQAIYSFRGADVFAYLTARRDAPRRYHLDVNHRSDAGLVRAVSLLFGRVARPFLVEGITLGTVRAKNPDAPGGLVAREGSAPPAPLELLLLGPEHLAATGAQMEVLLAQVAASEVSRLLGAGLAIGARPLSAGDIAVLVRTNEQVRAVARALAACDVPAVALGDESVFETREALGLERAMRAALDPRRLASALADPLFGLSAREIVALEQGDGEWNRFAAWAAAWTARGFARFARALVQELEPRLLGRVGGERSFTNLVHLCELAQQAEASEHLGPTALVEWLARQIASARQGRSEAAQVRLDRDEAAVTVTTVHKSKGLEYPVVLLPYVNDAIRRTKPGPVSFHEHDGDPRPKLALDMPSQADDPISQSLGWSPSAVRSRLRHEQHAEGMRLLYVALTRAKHHVVVVCGAFPDLVRMPIGQLLLGQSPPPSDAPGDRHARPPPLDEALASLLADGAGDLAVRPFGERAPPPPRAAQPVPVLTVRARPARLDPGPRTASFTALAWTAHDAPPVADDPGDGVDHDDVEPTPPLVEPTLPPSATGAAPLAGRLVLSDFPRGPHAGNFFHALLERLDFTAPGSVEPLARQLLLDHGFADESLVAPVVQGVHDLLGTELRPGLRLSDLPATARRNEVEFFLPVAPSATAASSVRDPQGSLFEEARAALTPAALATVFRDHPSDELERSYPALLAKLGFAPLRGFLKGYVDLVFEHEGSVYLVDYKTNHLGDTPADYAPARLRAAMSDGHYYLQYHLYALGLLRQLERGATRDEAAGVFGGAIYLFLRGIRPDLAAASGVFFERPPRERMAALARLFEVGQALASGRRRPQPVSARRTRGRRPGR